MGKFILYVFIILIANTLGAISGMGGGIIIKPALQFFGSDSAIVINFYSSVAVLVMSISSTFKQIKLHNQVDAKDVGLIGAGSIVGGILGDSTFKLFFDYFGNEISVAVQMILVILTLIFSLFVTSGKWKTYALTGSTVMVMIGSFLGAASTFLGIGGGPINTACFILVLGIGIRKATIYSIITIFFSQLAKISQGIILHTIPSVNPALVLVIAITAILGGWMGAIISNKIPPKSILTLFRGMIVSVLLLDLTNLCNIII